MEDRKKNGRSMNLIVLEQNHNRLLYDWKVYLHICVLLDPVHFFVGFLLFTPRLAIHDCNGEFVISLCDAIPSMYRLLWNSLIEESCNSISTHLDIAEYGSL